MIPTGKEAEAGGSQVEDLTGIQDKFRTRLWNLVRSCFKIASRKRVEGVAG